MSAVYIVLYAAAPLRFPDLKIVPARQATPFISEVEAWKACLDAGLSPANCECSPQDEAVKKEEA